MDLQRSSVVKYSLSERLELLQTRYSTLLCLLASIDVLGPLATDAHLPSLPKMTSDLHTSAGWIQFSVLSYSFILAISSLFGGYLSDKYGRRIITLFGLIFFILGGFGVYVSPNILILNLSRIVQGFGGGISSIVTSSVARDVFAANERMKILGVLGTLRPFAIAIAPMFGGLIAQTYGWRMVFFVTSSIAFIVCLATLIWLPETKQRFFILSNDEINVYESGYYSDSNPPNVIQLILSDVILLTVSFMLAFRMVAVFVFLNEFPFVVHHVYGYSELISGILIGSGALFLVIGAYVTIKMEKYGKVCMMKLAAICALTSCIFLIIGPIFNHWNKFINNNISFDDLYTNNDWFFIVIPFCILTFSQGLNGPPSNTIVVEPYPHLAGTISAVLVFWRLILPSIVMIIITQIVSKQTNHIASIIIFMTMALCGLLCFGLMYCGKCLSPINVDKRMNPQNYRRKKQGKSKNPYDFSSTLLEHSINRNSVNQ